MLTLRERVGIYIFNGVLTVVLLTMRKSKRLPFALVSSYNTNYITQTVNV